MIVLYKVHTWSSWMILHNANCVEWKNRNLFAKQTTNVCGMIFNDYVTRKVIIRILNIVTKHHVQVRIFIIIIDFYFVITSLSHTNFIYTLIITHLSISLQWTGDSPISVTDPKLVVTGLRPELAPILRLRLVARVVKAIRGNRVTWKPVQVRIVYCH